MYLNCFSKLFGLDLEVGEPGKEENLTLAPMGQLKVTRSLCLVVEVFLRAQLAWGETWMINDMFLMGRLFFSPMIYDWRRKISIESLKVRFDPKITDCAQNLLLFSRSVIFLGNEAFEMKISTKKNLTQLWTGVDRKNLPVSASF